MRRPRLSSGLLAAGAGAALVFATARTGIPDLRARDPVIPSADAREEPLFGGARPGGSDTLRFRHENHAGLECTECHANGQATVASRQQWCADCHHVSARPGECSRCHGTAQVRREIIPVLHTFRFSVGESKSRRLTFEHSAHSELACGECHTGADPTQVGRSCGSCHEPHHSPESDCMACHSEPRAGAHTEAVHRDGCGGSDCHAVAGMQRVDMTGTRSTCVVCHQAQRDHEPGGICAKCHLLGSRRSAPARQGSR